MLWLSARSTTGELEAWVAGVGAPVNDMGEVGAAAVIDALSDTRVEKRPFSPRDLLESRGRQQSATRPATHPEQGMPRVERSHFTLRWWHLLQAILLRCCLGFLVDAVVSMVRDRGPLVIYDGNDQAQECQCNAKRKKLGTGPRVNREGRGFCSPRG